MDKCYIRKASIDDIENVFKLSNSSYVRNNSIQSNQISWKEHTVWFHNELNHKYNFFYIIETLQHEFIGQLRLKYIEEYHYIISLTLLEIFHNQKFGTESLKQLFNIHNNFNFYAYIKDNNFRSQHFFQQFNFIKEKEIIINQNNFFIYKRVPYECHSNL